jgi:seryl-tRNA synthetase
VKQAKISNNIKKFDSLKSVLSETKAKIALLEAEAKDYDEKLRQFLLTIPNIPSLDIPDGKDENDNLIIKSWGAPKAFNFTPKEHFMIRGAKGLNFKDAAKISGSRFVIMEGAMATLHRALSQFMINTQIYKNGLTEIWAPVLVNKGSMIGTGQLPKFSEDSYSTSNGHWLIPTSEVSVTNIFSEKTLNSSDFPIRLTCHSQCFRSEAGSAGRDTTGMLRQHQFEKVEMVTVSRPEEGLKELDRMTECAQNILELLEIPYRTVLLCAGELGFSATKTYDIEAWLPGQGRFREISSCSTCGSFQARRMNARYRPSTDTKLEFVHTLNGSGLAVGRCLIAVLENFQEEDGSIQIPKVIQPYLNGANRILETGEFM